MFPPSKSFDNVFPEGKCSEGLDAFRFFLITFSKRMDEPGKVANPARGQLNRVNVFFSRPRSRLRIWSRETGSAVPSRVSLLISILRYPR